VQQWSLIIQQLFPVPVDAFFGQQSQCLYVKSVLCAEHPRCQCLGIVIRQYRYAHLYDYRTTVKFLSHEVYTGAMLSEAGLQCALVGIQAAQRWQ
jgi:hypothetical protein